MTHARNLQLPFAAFWVKFYCAVCKGAINKGELIFKPDREWDPSCQVISYVSS
jgi:hypothetical protein